MPTKVQKNPYQTTVINTRIDDGTYLSMLSLMNAAGYRDVSSFLRQTVITKCRDIAADIAEEMANKAESLV